MVKVEIKLGWLHHDQYTSLVDYFLENHPQMGSPTMSLEVGRVTGNPPKYEDVKVGFNTRGVKPGEFEGLARLISKFKTE